MMIIMRADAAESEIAAVVERLTESGCFVRRSGSRRSVLGVAGAGFEPDGAAVRQMPGVERVEGGDGGCHLVGRELRPEDTVIEFPNGVRIGGREVTVIAGPCSVRDRDATLQVAERVRRAGARILRGGAFKPRTSPYSFQGLGEEGLYILREAADAHGLLTISEVLEASQIPLAEHYCDILQVGARNMQNFPLLRELGRSDHPVMLKRSPGGTLDEWLSAAEYLAACGNENMLLCERGIRTFETATRHTLDLNAVPALKERTHLPVCVDPSHGTGRRSLVPAMAAAAVAAGADAVMVEVDADPDGALSDGGQTLTLPQFEQMIAGLRGVAEATGRTIVAA
jgi:3-deoxy-7-phosphoheptulonate synthase